MDNNWKRPAFQKIKRIQEIAIQLRELIIKDNTDKLNKLKELYKLKCPGTKHH